jgi:hypothetical protein
MLLLLPSDTHRTPLTTITAVLPPFVTYLLTRPRSFHGPKVFRLQMGTICSSDMLVLNCQTTRCHNPEDYSMNLHRREAVAPVTFILEVLGSNVDSGRNTSPIVTVIFVRFILKCRRMVRHLGVGHGRFLFKFVLHNHCLI